MDNSLWHVTPVSDSSPHVEEGTECSCQPKLDGKVVIHNAFDSRELLENVEQKASDGGHQELVHI